MPGRACPAAISVGPRGPPARGRARRRQSGRNRPAVRRAPRAAEPSLMRWRRAWRMSARPAGRVVVRVEVNFTPPAARRWRERRSAGALAPSRARSGTALEAVAGPDAGPVSVEALRRPQGRDGFPEAASRRRRSAARRSGRSADDDRRERRRGTATRDERPGRPSHPDGAAAATSDKHAGVRASGRRASLLDPSAHARRTSSATGRQPEAEHHPAIAACNSLRIRVPLGPLCSPADA
jgi:hypothetical protein